MHGYQHRVAKIIDQIMFSRSPKIVDLNQDRFKALCLKHQDSIKNLNKDRTREEKMMASA